MPRIETRHLINFTPEQMFTLVADVERYPEFVPMCEKLVLRRRLPQADGSVVLIADMTVGYKMIRETFTSRVELYPTTADQPEGRINVAYLDGPFEKLNNYWRFSSPSAQPRKDETRQQGDDTFQQKACEIDFFLEYSFKNRLLEALSGAVFEKLFSRMIEAFEKRAQQLYR